MANGFAVVSRVAFTSTALVKVPIVVVLARLLNTLAGTADGVPFFPFVVAILHLPSASTVVWSWYRSFVRRICIVLSPNKLVFETCGGGLTWLKSVNEPDH